jgi:GTP-binding protein
VNYFVTSASVAGPRDGVLRDDIPQFAFAGRSNVGKSTLINAIMRQKLARTSAAAGKTRQANIFLMTVSGGIGAPGSWSAYLVDLPGYGYARGGRESVAELGAVVSAYFDARERGKHDARERGNRESPRRGAIFLLVDARHPGLASDLEAFEWISANAETPRIVATKVDKLSRAERTRNLRAIAGAFDQTPIAVSSDAGEGLEELRRLIANLARGTNASA